MAAAARFFETPSTPQMGRRRNPAMHPAHGGPRCALSSAVKIMFEDIDYPKIP
jgi:hypothetical protein